MVLKIAGIGLDAATGDRLEQAQYKEDFRRRLQDIDGQDMLKLERRQVFRQPGTPSWEAFVRGDWEQALRIYQDKLETLRASLAARRDRGIDYRRVRVVEKPIIPYVQWELNVFRVRTAAGGADSCRRAGGCQFPGTGRAAPGADQSWPRNAVRDLL